MSFRALTAEQLVDLYPERPLSWTDYAEGHLSGPVGRVLDYGCSHGQTLRRLESRANGLWGVDVDDENFPVGAAAAGLQLSRINPREPLPFADGFFDTCVITEVIEHVADERFVLTELARVLKTGGRLLLTTPHRGLLTWMDPANYKFVFPTFHRWIHCYVLRNPAYYQERFGASRRTHQGMIADFTTDQDPWHRHYTCRRILALVPPTLQEVEWAVYFPAMRALWVVAIVGRMLRRDRVGKASWLNRINHRLSRCPGRMGDQLVICFRKAG